MKTINQDELFQNVKQFLQGRGVDLKEGSYTRRLQQCCGLLTDVVNTTNRTVSRACAEVDRKLKEVRETIRRRPGGRGSKPGEDVDAPPKEEAAAPAPTAAPARKPGTAGTRGRGKPTGARKVAASAKPKAVRRRKPSS